MTKRLFALLSALVLIFSVLPLSAFATTGEGMYNGYRYTANLATTTSTATTKMTYEGTTKVSSNGTVYYIDSNGRSATMSLTTLPNQHSSTGTKSVPTGCTISRVRQYYYVYSTQVDYLSATPS